MNYLIVNPASGAERDAEFWLERLRRAGVSAALCPAETADQLPALGRNDRLLVAGGDGTLRRFASACMDQGAALGVLPSGTGNDFARGLDIPLDPEAACGTIAGGRVVRVDVGRIDDEVFLNVAHVGLGSEVGPGVGPQIKRWWGRMGYLRTALNRLRDRRGFRARIRCDRTVATGRWLEIAVANGPSFGGGQRIFEASPFDGCLDLLAVRPRPLSRLLGVWLRAWLRRATPRDEAVVRLRGRECSIEARRARNVSADGELVGGTPACFSVARGALRVIVPSGSAADNLDRTTTATRSENRSESDTRS